MIRARTRQARAARERGAVALEAALVLPLVALVMVAVLQVGAVVRQALVVQDAARLGARIAATSGDAAVTAAVHAIVDGAHVTVRPRRRGPGDVVTVTVTAAVRVGGLVTEVRGRAATLVEPGAS